MAPIRSSPAASRRSESSRVAILDAALALCQEEGYANLSIEGIAARAGVGKQTIYRWWSSKGAVLLEALDRAASEAAAFPDTGDLVADMRATLGDIAGFHADPKLGLPLAALIAEAQQDPGIAPRMLATFFGPRRAPILERLRAAQRRGELDPDLALEPLLEVMLGALFHRLLLRSGPLDAEYVSYIVDVLFAGGATARRVTHEG